MTDATAVSLSAAGSLSLAGTVTTGALGLTATGAIAQPGGSLIATSLTGSAGAGGASLTQAANQIGTLLAFASAGNFALTDSNPVSVAGAVSVANGGTLTVMDNAPSFAVGGSLTALNGTVVLAEATPGTGIVLGGGGGLSGSAPVTAATLVVGAPTGGALTVAGAFNLSAVGTLDLESGAAITETPSGSIRIGTLTGHGASAALGGANQIGTLGLFATTGAFALTDAQGLAVSGPLTASTASLNVAWRAVAVGQHNRAHRRVAGGDRRDHADGRRYRHEQPVGLGGIGVAGQRRQPGDEPRGLRHDRRLPAVRRAEPDGDGSGGPEHGDAVGDGQPRDRQHGRGRHGGPYRDGGDHGDRGRPGDGRHADRFGGLGLAPAGQRGGDAGELRDHFGVRAERCAGADRERPGDGRGFGVVEQRRRADPMAGTIAAPAIDLVSTGNLSMSVAGGINQTGGMLSAAMLTGSSSGTASLTSAANAVGTLGSFSSVGGFALADGQSLTVAGPVTDATAVSLSAAGSLSLAGTVTTGALGLTATGAIAQPGGSLIATSLTGSAGTGGASLTQAANQIGTLLAFASAGNFALTDSNPVSVAGAVSVANGGTLTVTDNAPSFAVGGSLTALNGTVVLAEATPGAGIVLGGGGGLSGSAPVTAATLVVGAPTGGALTVAGAFNLSAVGTLDLESGAAITETPSGSIRIGTLTGHGASAALGGANQIGTLGLFATTGAFALTDAQGLAVSGPLTASMASLNVTGALALSGSITWRPQACRWRRPARSRRRPAVSSRTTCRARRHRRRWAAPPTW